jgi:GT2 family glycosyltransferase
VGRESNIKSGSEMSDGRSVAIGAVVVNYRSENNTRRVADQLSETCTKVCVVDNSAPSPDLRKWIKQREGIEYIDSGGNIGYAAGNNMGIRELAKECGCYFIVNPDIEIPDPETPMKLAQRLVEHSEIGIIAPAIGDAPKSRQHGDTFAIQLLHWLNRIPPIRDRNDGLIPRPQVIGCAMMVSAELIRELGPLDPEFFLYNEEIEFCYRARESGYQVVYDPSCKVYHEQEDGLSHPEPYQMYYRTRNAFLLGRRRFNRLTRLCYLTSVLVLFYSIVSNMCWKLLAPWLWGIIDGFRGVEGKTRYITE